MKFYVTMNLDAIMQKYLRGEATSEEKDFLLDQALWAINIVTAALKAFKRQPFHEDFDVLAERRADAEAEAKEAAKEGEPRDDAPLYPD